MPFKLFHLNSPYKRLSHIFINLKKHLNIPIHFAKSSWKTQHTLEIIMKNKIFFLNIFTVMNFGSYKKKYFFDNNITFNKKF